MASDAGDPPGLPLQLVTHEVHGRIGQISLTMINDQTLLAKVMDVMGFAVAVVGFLGSFVGNRQCVKDRSSAIFAGLLVFLLKMSVKGL
jgi:hypothetical protein